MEPFLVALLLGFIGVIVHYIDVIYIQKNKTNTSSIIKVFSFTVGIVLLASSFITTNVEEITQSMPPNSVGQDMMTGNAPF